MIGEEPTDEPGDGSRMVELALDDEEELLEAVRSSDGMSG